MKTSKADGMVIAAYTYTGKEALADKYANVLRLQATPYSKLGHDPKTYKPSATRKEANVGETNSEWPGNYIEALKQSQKKYDYILTIASPEKMLNHLDNARIAYTIIFPKPEDMDIIKQRSKERGHSPEVYNNLRGADSFLERTKGKNYEISYLKRGEFLEDWFKRNGLKLVPKHKEK